MQCCDLMPVQTRAMRGFFRFEIRSGGVPVTITGHGIKLRLPVARQNCINIYLF